MNIISIREYAIADPESFYTQRWECGFMVYHGRFNWFSTSISEAKAKLIEIRDQVAFKFLISETHTTVYGDCLNHEREYTSIQPLKESVIVGDSRVFIEQIYPLNPSAYEYAKRRAASLRFKLSMPIETRSMLVEASPEIFKAFYERLAEKKLYPRETDAN
jgi:hypothetical protein